MIIDNIALGDSYPFKVTFTFDGVAQSLEGATVTVAMEYAGQVLASKTNDDLTFADDKMSAIGYFSAADIVAKGSYVIRSHISQGAMHDHSLISELRVA